MLWKRRIPQAKNFWIRFIQVKFFWMIQYYTDNGKEYKGDPRHHAYMKLCAERHIEQRFTKVRNPKTNGKAERVIKTLMDLWHHKTRF